MIFLVASMQKDEICKRAGISGDTSLLAFQKKMVRVIHSHFPMNWKKVKPLYSVGGLKKCCNSEWATSCRKVWLPNDKNCAWFSNARCRGGMLGSFWSAYTWTNPILVALIIALELAYRDGSLWVCCCELDFSTVMFHSCVDLQSCKGSALNAYIIT